MTDPSTAPTAQCLSRAVNVTLYKSVIRRRAECCVRSVSKRTKPSLTLSTCPMQSIVKKNCQSYLSPARTRRVQRPAIRVQRPAIRAKRPAASSRLVTTRCHSSQGGYGDEWFKCEVFGKYRGKYNLYFLVDGAVLKHVDEDKLREPGETDEWTKMKRTDFLGKNFMVSDQQWKVLEIGKGRRINKYKCENLSSEETLFLDISQVQNAIRSDSS